MHSLPSSLVWDKNSKHTLQYSFPYCKSRDKSLSIGPDRERLIIKRAMFLRGFLSCKVSHSESDGQHSSLSINLTAVHVLTIYSRLTGHEDSFCKVTEYMCVLWRSMDMKKKKKKAVKYHRGSQPFSVQHFSCCVKEVTLRESEVFPLVFLPPPSLPLSLSLCLSRSLSTPLSFLLLTNPNAPLQVPCQSTGCDIDLCFSNLHRDHYTGVSLITRASTITGDLPGS